MKLICNKMVISSIALMSVGIILRLIFNNFVQLRFWWPANLFNHLAFFSGIMLAFISLYKVKLKITMIAGIAACALLHVLLVWLYCDFIWKGNIRNIILSIFSGVIILAFILLYKKRHKIILISGLAVIVLFFLFQLSRTFGFGWEGEVFFYYICPYGIDTDNGLMDYKNGENDGL